MSTTAPETTLTAVEPDDELAAWERKLARVAQRPLLERTWEMRDEDADQAVVDAMNDVGRAKARARAVANQAHADVEDEAVRLALVEADIAADADVQAAEAVYGQRLVEQEEATVRIPFRALRRDAYEELKGQCPPTPEQRKIGHAYNSKRFEPLLVAASSINPMTPEQAAGLVGGEVVDAEGAVTVYTATLSNGESEGILATVWIVNESKRGDLGKV